MTTNQYRFSTHFLPCGLVKAKSEQHIKEKLQATKITGKEHKSCPDMELSPYNKEKRQTKMPVSCADLLGNQKTIYHFEAGSPNRIAKIDSKNSRIFAMKASIAIEIHLLVFFLQLYSNMWLTESQ